MTPHRPTDHGSRPRVEGEREAEILDATLQVLVDVGYDRLTMDAVAAARRASKATLYRRWNAKVSLVIDALLATKEAPVVPDTGSLRGDLRAMFCGIGGLTDAEAVGDVRQRAHRGRPRPGVRRGVPDARSSAPRSPPPSRSGSAPAPAARSAPTSTSTCSSRRSPGSCCTACSSWASSPTEDLVTRVIDQIILPAATRAPTLPRRPRREGTS